MTYNDPEIVRAINNVEQRKAEIKSLSRAGRLNLRTNPWATLRGWANLFHQGLVNCNPAIPR